MADQTITGDFELGDADAGAFDFAAVDGAFWMSLIKLVSQIC